jgi:hypothetical protein
LLGRRALVISLVAFHNFGGSGIVAVIAFAIVLGAIVPLL